MPAKRQKSSSSSSSTNCDTIPTIKQRFGTCWFNALLTCLLYGDKSKKIFKRKLRNPNLDELIEKHFKKLIKKIKLYEEKLEDIEEEEEEEEQLHRLHTFKLASAKHALQEVKELLIQILLYTEQTDIVFDMAINLLIELNNYDSNVFNIEPSTDSENLHYFYLCPANIHIQVAYAVNIYKMFGIKAFVIQKTLTEIGYEDKCVLFEYKPHQSNVIEYDDTPDVIIVVDDKNESTSAIIETLKYKDKNYSLDSLKFCNVKNTTKANLHAIACVKCKKKYYISDTNCNRLLPIDIKNNNSWYIKKEYGSNSINCSEIVYDTNKQEMLFNFYNGSTRKIFFYLKTKSKSDQYSLIYNNEGSILLVPSVIYEDNS
tara:strand:+ start:721 stop:1836 length:1116 start_codon:yes stop_codon:yes gene_type:complete